MKQTFILAHEVARDRALRAVQGAPGGWVVSLSEPTRNSEQNALLHALLTEIAAAKTWAGAMMHIDDWRRLLTSAWWRERGGC